MTQKDPKRLQKLMDLADRLWLSRGYTGFSFADLSSGTGLKKPSVYHYFPSKRHLILALIAHHTDRGEAFYKHVNTLPAPQALSAFFSVYEGLLQHPDCICPAGAICSDLETLPADAALAGKEYLRSQREWLQRTLTLGAWSMDARDTATAVLSSLQGALQRSRATGDSEVLRSTLRVWRTLLALS